MRVSVGVAVGYEPMIEKPLDSADPDSLGGSGLG